MSAPFFFKRGHGLTVREIVALAGGEPRPGADLDRRITGIAALDGAAPSDLTFLASLKYADQAAGTAAGACLTLERFADRVPDHVSVLSLRAPYRAFVEVARALFPDALRPSSLFEASGVAPGAFVHPTARAENGVIIDPGAVIGPGAEIGAGTVIGAGAVVGPGVRIGRACSIGANVSMVHTLMGDRVIIHPGCSIGQDGFGFVMGASGHRKVPQVGRVIIQDDVEIGAGTTIDRGANRDTVIGEGTKIDNLVQVGHNVSIGRHCVVVAQSGISGSATIEDFVVLGARVGVNNHATIGEGAQLAATANVKDDVPPGARWGGTPAKPARIWAREMYALKQLAMRAESDTIARVADSGREDEE
jgi:UDP-3-O-[3-hydroxymyristoyl] glucosamine N-acyltransferase